MRILTEYEWWSLAHLEDAETAIHDDGDAGKARTHALLAIAYALNRLAQPSLPCHGDACETCINDDDGGEAPSWNAP